MKTNVVYMNENKRDKLRLKNGYTKISNGIIEDLAAGDFNKIHYKILLALIRKTYGYDKDSDRISNSQFSQLTGLNEREVRRGIKELFDRGIIERVGGQRGVLKYKKVWSVEPVENTPTHEPVENTPTRFEPVENTPTEPEEFQPQQKKRKKDITSTKVDVGHLASQDDPGTPAKSNPSIPFQKIVDLYHELLPICPKVQKLNEKRKGYIRQRIAQKDLPDLETWAAYFNYCAKSQFLMGLTNGTNGRPPFIANLEWITNPNHFTDIWEGKYHRS